MDINTLAATGRGGTNPISGPGPRVDPRQFLTLLTTQLRNQDPFQPTSNTEFIGQLAQLSQLQEQQSQNETLTSIDRSTRATTSLQGLAQASGLIGKEITYVDSTGEHSGVVSKVSFARGTIELEIGDQSVSLGSVLSVAERG